MKDLYRELCRWLDKEDFTVFHEAFRDSLQTVKRLLDDAVAEALPLVPP